MTEERLQTLIIQEEDERSDILTPHIGIITTSHKRARHYKIIVLVCLVSTISIASIVLSVTSLIQCNELKQQTRKSSGFCVVCSELYPVGYVDERVEETIASLDRHLDDGVEICCAKNNSGKSEIMKLQLKRRDSLTYPRISNSSKIDMNNFNFGSISAHKTLTSQGIVNGKSNPNFGDEFYMLRLRQYNDVRFEHVSGVDVTPSGLKVKVAGLYFVYKSIYFVPDSSHPCKHFQEQTFRSLLLRNSTLRSSRTDILLRSEHTCCPECVQNRETSFTGGIFYLDQGDLIEVEISAYGLVYFKPDVTYMGIIIVSMPVLNQ